MKMESGNRTPFFLLQKGMNPSTDLSHTNFDYIKEGIA